MTLERHHAKKIDLKICSITCYESRCDQTTQLSCMGKVHVSSGKNMLTVYKVAVVSGEVIIVIVVVMLLSVVGLASCLALTRLRITKTSNKN